MQSKMQQAVSEFKRKIDDLELGTAKTLGSAIEAIHAVEAVSAERLEAAMEKICNGQNMIVEGYNELIALQAEREKGILQVASDIKVLQVIRTPAVAQLQVVGEAS